MPKKKGPPYLDDPECKYVVIENPWPSGRSTCVRDEAYYQEVAAWLRYALNKAAWPETIYSRNKRSDLIVKFAQEVDVKPLLGAHFWPNFLKQPGARIDISFIFEFNYRRNGHPENHQWTLHEVDWGDPRRWGGNVPFKQPYPPPAFAQLQNNKMSCADLALPMPKPRDEPAGPEPQPEAPPPPEADAAAQARESREPSSLYAFAHGLTPKVEAVPARSLAPEPAVESQRNRSETLAGLPVPDAPPQARASVLERGKLDPYEEEEATANILKAEPSESRLPHVGIAVKREGGSSSVKPEPGPSDELRREFEEYRQRLGAPTAVKGEPYRPSAELIAEFNDYKNPLQHAALPEEGLSPATLAFREELQRKQSTRSRAQSGPHERYRGPQDRYDSKNSRQETNGMPSMKPEADASAWSFHRDRQGSSASFRARSYAGSDPERGYMTQHEQRGGDLDISSTPRLAQASESRAQSIRDRMSELDPNESVKRERGEDDSWSFKRRRY